MRYQQIGRKNNEKDEKDEKEMNYTIHTMKSEHNGSGNDALAHA